MRVCTSAGEALPESSRQCLAARGSEVDILDGVGSTELLHIFLSNAPGDIKLRLVRPSGARLQGAAGQREPVPTSPMARSANCWSARPRPATATGINAPKSRAHFREGAWTRTGDKYTRDADGRYTFCGRADDMFKVSGIWVSPFEVETR